MRLLLWILVLVVAVALASFAASNREAVSLGLWPFPFVAELPLYLSVLLALSIGFVIGALTAWIRGGRWRREARRRGRRVRALEHELAATQAQLADAEAPAPPKLPALATHD